MSARLLANLVPLIPRPIVRRISRRYIAGDALEDALRVIGDLNRRGIRGTIDVLGEFVTTMNQAEAARAMDHRILDGIVAAKVNGNLSVKLTTLGLKIDFESCCRAIGAIVGRAAELGMLVRLDMEDSSCTTLTLDVYRRLRADGHANVGIVLQSYMRRSAADIDALPADGLNVRLCKGIYREPAAIAFQSRADVRRNFSALLRQLLDRGAFVAVATHDDVLIDDAGTEIDRRGLAPDAYEFQMLLGVREERRDGLVAAGRPMRVYVPFGLDWYGYATRRLRENPQIALYVTKALFGLE